MSGDIHIVNPHRRKTVETSRFQFRARLRVRALSLLAASVAAATVLAAAITPVLLGEATQPAGSSVRA
jgi:hypothetical protein